MRHLSQDELVLLAFGEKPESAAAAEHAAGCADCQAEIDVLRQLAQLGRETDQFGDLPEPPERVWRAIAAQTGAPGSPPGRPIVQRVPWLKPVLAAAAAAVVAVAGTWAVLRPGGPEPAKVVASAKLAAFGSTPVQAGGRASVLAGGWLAVDVANLPPAGGGYYEVWLIDPGTSQMFSVGVLGSDPAATFPLPPGADLAKYKMVDVSVERFDNQPAHSGNSLLRGVLVSGADLARPSRAAGPDRP